MPLSGRHIVKTVLLTAVTNYIKGALTLYLKSSQTLFPVIAVILTESFEISKRSCVASSGEKQRQDTSTT